MLKTIKRTKQIRLDELIKYVWDNDIKDKTFCSSIKAHINGLQLETPKHIKVSSKAAIDVRGTFNDKDFFEVEIEEEITEDTEFEQGVVVLKYGAIITFSKSSFGYLKQKYAGQQFKIYVLIDGGLELIYEVDNNGEE